MSLALGQSELAPDQWAALDHHLAAGLRAFAVPSPMTLEQWAREHFYLSAESSYVEQQWTPWPFQRAILACIGNDDITDVSLKKSARVGYTKLILAAIGYFAEHKHRNQALWQPTDDDAEDFVKSELDPMLRDVAAMQAIFPAHLSRHKDNTLQKKRFIGSTLRVRGGKASTAYRRISVDVAYLDELDAFDPDVEKEGDPCTLARKRTEGATFPKFVCGSTPKLRGYSLIEDRYTASAERFTFQIACPHCGQRHALTWGGKDIPHGFKWTDDDPATVMHLCPHCAALISQADYLSAADAGLWVNERGDLHLHHDGRFTTPAGERVPAPASVGLHVWTAYSPVVPWPQIVAEFFEAFEKMRSGDDARMKAWTNTTLGNTWEGEIERTDADDLKNRAENFALRQMPRDCLLLLCGVDTQDNRLEAGVWGLGVGGEMWTIDHQVFHGNPALPKVWDELEEFLLQTQYTHACGIPQRIYATAIDSGGHHADAVYAFAHRLKAHRVHAVKGSSHRERSIDNGNSRVEFRWNGRIEKHGPTLWMVGTNLAKDRFQSRLDVPTPGPGYVHLAKDLSDEWFKQLAGEVRATRRTQGGSETRWSPVRNRIEVRDCLTYAIFLEERLALWHPRKGSWWRDLAARVQPPDDLFTTSQISSPDVPRESSPEANHVDPQAEARPRSHVARRRPGGFATNW